MKNRLLALFLSTFSLLSFAQKSDSLKLGKTNREFFIKGGQSYKFSEYKKVFTNPQALEYMKKANSNSTLGQIFGFTGGAFMGFGIVKALQKDKVNYINYGYGTIALTQKRNQGGWALAGIGAGVSVIGIVVSGKANKNLKKAVDTENGTVTANTAYYKVGFTGDGVALSYNF
ncbi:hypothetical protein M2347_001542 [Chryseobacterium sp. H1D6B]|uniref:hypothetical protein n=1 Tax=Chryseobacterium sp. H1D6B TaxID=2940588 RepID=UPI0015C93686|nr:hypothetical protein [Chryseobacterium sp. H1D6B]MDH6251815.1 hypothetical protein [Chryseobacterium sp. H1D6B]